ncbi:MAG: nitrate/nitrite transporter NrtS [Planctomycetia bacterium]|nr:nitrate/nitrite transporter NrtS [Planctomycetia bacterium]
MALQWPVVRRALWCAVLVGAVLITINHGNAIRLGDVTRSRLLQMGLTLLVPYCVSTYSSVSAMRAERRSDDQTM